MARSAVLLLAAAALLFGAPAHADSPIRLFRSFAGNVSFTGTQKTMRTKSNTDDACSVNTNPQTMVLNSIPQNAVVLSAHLYWAGSGDYAATPSAADYTVTFDNVSVTAPINRQYTSATTGSKYFSGAVDVTAQVKVKGNADYTVGGLTIDSSSTYCSSQAVLGGFQLLVVYSLPTETFRVLNIYEGFQYSHNSSFVLTLGNFLIPDPIGNKTGKIGAMTWEGDSTLSSCGTVALCEVLRYNDVEVSDGLNPAGNQFNSVSNINNDSLSYGIDFDAYVVGIPIINGGQSSASTTYKTGSDLVLTSAEIIAAPNVPATDRSITMALNGTLAPSVTSSYTITVGNNGPMAEGALVVTDLLPNTLIYSGATGTDWNCGAVQQRVTCTYTKSLPIDTQAPAITLNVTVGAAATGLISNSATVSGALFDYYDGNNTATISARIGVSPFTPYYVFTDQPCVHNMAFGSSAQPCHRLTLDNPHQMSNTDINVYLTYVVNNIPVAFGISDTTMQMKFALSCHSPAQNAGVRATFSAVNAALPLCEADGAVPLPISTKWSALTNVVFTGGGASSNTVYRLRYADVGRIEFFVSDSINRLGSTGAFVSRPNLLVLTVPTTNRAGTPAAATDAKFIAAGASFTLSVTAMTGGFPAVAAANFGKESPAASVRLTPTVGTDSTGAKFTEMVEPTDPNAVPPFYGSFGSFNAGTATGTTFRFDEVGIIRLQLDMTDGDYLGSGNVFGNTVNLGRFVPDHFDTVVVPSMLCDTGLACPASVAGMAYSTQSFTTQVTARNTSGAQLRNYRGLFARDVTLSAYAALGSASNPSPPSSPSGSVLSANTITASAFVAGAGSAVPVYTFPAANAYSRTTPQANNWVAPTFIYLRASESTVPSVGDGVTSLRGTASVEGGMAIVTGRLMLQNAYGSELVPLPLKVWAQYYKGALVWSNNTKDSSSGLAPVTDLAYANCNRGLRVSNACKLSVLVPRSSSAITLVQSAGTILLQAPGTGNNGQVDITASNPSWLPSTKARVVFGIYRSPFIYLREMY
ncbi:MAG: DUF11 domain-containing protein [Pseudomonadota bacterium]